jgi:hypothetical protein
MGFAAGFQVGAQAVERGLKMREENEQRERIKAAMGLTAQEVEQRQATPDELGRARAETQAMAAQDAEVFGLTPQEQGSYAPQMPVEGQRIGLNRYQVGQQSFDRMPSQNEIEDVRYGAAANVLAERDPVAAQRMRRELRIAKQQDELYPLQKQQLEGALAGQTQALALGGEQLTTAQRTNQLAIGNQNAQNALAEMRAGNKPITSQTLAQIAKDNKADYNTLLASELNQIGFTEKTAAVEMKNLSRDWSKAVLGGAPTINKFLAAKFDPDKTDNITPELVQTKNGFVVMYGKNVLNEYGTHKDLNTLAAQVSGMINDDPLGTLKTLAAVKASNAAAATSEAELGLIPGKKAMYGAQANYYNNRGQLDKMGATQYFTGDDGNLYANTPVFKKDGTLEFQSTKVNPENVKFQKPGTEGKDMKPGKVAEEGEKATIGGQLRISDGLGNWVPAGPNGKPLGVLPSDRTKFLEKANIPTNMIPQIPWNTNGTEVMFGGKAYEVNNPADIKELKADYKRLGANTIAVEEEQRNIPGRNTGLFAVGQPYDPYGASQRPRMGATQAEVDAFNAQKALQARNRAIAQRQTDLYNAQQLGLE